MANTRSSTPAPAMVNIAAPTHNNNNNDNNNDNGNGNDNTTTSTANTLANDTIMEEDTDILEPAEVTSPKTTNVSPATSPNSEGVKRIASTARNEIAKAKTPDELKEKQKKRKDSKSELPHSLPDTFKSGHAASVTPTLHTSKSLSTSFLLSEKELQSCEVLRNLSTPALYEHALKFEEKQGTHLTSTGALATLSGKKTGRSPKDKRVVSDTPMESAVWRGLGSPNIPLNKTSFLCNRETALDYLGSLERLYVFDGYANWDEKHRVKVRVVCARPYHALFINNLLIRPSSEDELAAFGVPDFTIYNAGSFPANRFNDGVTSSASVSLNLESRELVILGTNYAGEMKKGVFTYMHYLMPTRGVLTLHSGCNVGKDGDTTLFFGLSGTGKTTLSTDRDRPLVGDDEHCWSDDGVSNIEGGCYAKCIDLSAEHEPEIFQAIRYGTVVENVVFSDRSRVIDYHDCQITENTRAAYPIDFIANAKLPCLARHPKNIIMLCCDAYGVLPPVSKLTIGQAMFMFVSGYTAKVAGTEDGVLEPEATFSACFGGAFLVWHPFKYASMLAERMVKHGSTAWLVNTGWTGGKYGVGSRMQLKYTRAIVDAIHDGSLSEDLVTYHTTGVFNLQVPRACPGVPDNILDPSLCWSDLENFQATLRMLACLYQQNFAKYETAMNSPSFDANLVKAIRDAAPDVVLTR